MQSVHLNREKNQSFVNLTYQNDAIIVAPYCMYVGRL